MSAAHPTDKLRAWLESRLDALPPGAVLPTSAALGRRFGLSVRTVNTVMKPYMAAGRIVRIRGRGTFIGGADTDAAQDTAPPRSSAERIADAVKESISTGDLKFGDQLPPVTFMSRQFHVTPSTVTAAYRALARERYAVRVGRSYWIGGFKNLVSMDLHKQVLLLHREGHAFDEIFEDDLYTTAYLKMERELASQGYAVHVVDMEDDEAVRAHIGDAPPYGVVLYRHDGGRFGEAAPLLKRLMPRPTRTERVRVPLLLDWRFGRVDRPPPDTHILHRGNLSTAAGKTVAACVTQKRYRSVVFFVEEDLGNTENRFWNFVRCLKVRIELANLDASVSARFCVSPSRPGLNPSRFIEAEAVANRRYGEHYLEALLGKYRQLTLAAIQKEIDIVGPSPLPYASYRDADLWVFASIGHAAEALEWCRLQRIAVPRRLSILSLENDAAHFGSGISCADIDWENVGYLMAHAVIGDIPVARTRRGFIRCGARVIGRGTTR